jgi:hypothetical protein
LIIFLDKNWIELKIITPDIISRTFQTLPSKLDERLATIKRILFNVDYFLFYFYKSKSFGNQLIMR